MKQKNFENISKKKLISLYKFIYISINFYKCRHKVNNKIIRDRFLCINVTL